MMEREQSKHANSSFRAWPCCLVALTLTLVSACASAANHSAETKAATQLIPQIVSAAAGGVRAEISTGEASNGHAIVLSVVLPSGIDPETLKASYLGTDLPFFEPTVPGLQTVLKQSGETKLAVGETIRQAFFGIPFEQKPGETKVLIEAGAGAQTVKLELALKVVEGDYVIESLKVNPSRVNPSKKSMPRILAEVREVGKIYRNVVRTRSWDGPFQFPIESAITSRYGNKRIYNGEMRNYHSGTDLRAPVGTPLRAAQGGTVVLAKNLYFSGNTVIIDHGFGFQTMYAHMSAFKVKKGQVVKMGDQLGLSGATGRVSGPHLHWTWILHKVKVDPMQAMQVLK